MPTRDLAAQHQPPRNLLVLTQSNRGIKDSRSNSKDWIAHPVPAYDLNRDIGVRKVVICGSIWGRMSPRGTQNRQVLSVRSLWEYAPFEPEMSNKGEVGDGRGDRVRTDDLMLPKHARYQLRHAPTREDRIPKPNPKVGTEGTCRAKFDLILGRGWRDPAITTCLKARQSSSPRGMLSGSRPDVPASKPVPLRRRRG